MVKSYILFQTKGSKTIPFGTVHTYSAYTCYIGKYSIPWGDRPWRDREMKRPLKRDLVEGMWGGEGGGRVSGLWFTVFRLNNSISLCWFLAASYADIQLQSTNAKKCDKSVNTVVIQFSQLQNMMTYDAITFAKREVGPKSGAKRCLWASGLQSQFVKSLYGNHMSDQIYALQFLDQKIPDLFSVRLEYCIRIELELWNHKIN